MTVRFTLCGLLFLSSLFLHAQNDESSDLKALASSNWYEYTGGEKLSAEAFLQKYKTELGYSPEDQLLLQRTSQGPNGDKHLHYQQYFRGVPVEAGELVLHLKEGAVYLVNGEIVKALQGDLQLNLDESTAFRKALSYFPAEQYRWELEQKARPQGQLFWTDKNFSNSGAEYSLCWRFDIHSLSPEERHWVYINAQNGDLELALSRIHSHDTGTAKTRYSGTRTIYTSFDSLSGKYVLRDSLSGGGIYTYNMEMRTNKSTAIDFYDEDNYWNNFNAQFDEVAGDAHWGSERVYHYFKNHYNRLSYDNQNSALHSYVHYDSNYVNAFWNGQEMTYGDGNGIAATPLISLDVVAHEITHGVTEYTANLIYQGESGALNESFSDIFGAAIEFAYDSAGGDWKMGEDFLNTGNGLRNMKNPGQFNHPHTYLGQNWGQGLFFDNGYVHSNSGVQNFWYYLLSDGDTGINDLGDRYDVQGLGFQKAADIAYHNLNNYLTRWSDHEDARMGALQSAIDLYGSCSNEYIQTANAWYAVGLGEGTGDYDLSVDDIVLASRDCGFGANEAIIIALRNNSCSQSIPAGTSFNFSYRINSGPLQTMSSSLSASLPADSVVYIQHNQNADLSQPGSYDIFASLNFSQDSLNYNNFAEKRVIHENYQNAEWKLLKVEAPLSGCELGDSTNFKLSAVFLGCDSLPTGTSIDLDYSLNGSASQNLNTQISQSAHYGDTLLLSFNSTEDLSARGLNNFNFTLSFPGDPNINNNRIFNHRVLKPYELLGGKIGFEDFAYTDSLIVREGLNNGSRRNGVASVGNRGFEIVGGPLVNYGGDFAVPRNDSTVWQVNPSFRSSYCTCVDARNETGLSLHFDLKQAHTRLIRRLRSEPSNSPYTSSLRVLANGQQQGPTFIPLTANSDNFQSQSIDLSDFAGQYFELCFESHLLVDARTNNITNDGDIINLDNIYLNTSGLNTDQSLNNGALSLELFPNPNQGQFRLDWSSALEGRYKMWILDAQGRIVYRRTIETEAGKQSWAFKPQLPDGLYFVQVEDPTGKVSTREMLIQP